MEKNLIIEHVVLQAEMVRLGFETNEPDEIVPTEYWSKSQVKIAKSPEGYFYDVDTNITVKDIDDVKMLLKLKNNAI